ncbi:MAG: hypothetical protein AB1467_05885 [Candidatus Diapherotrites archaeon]
MELRNRKGQAAITDALYFLLIVTGLVTFLFYFSGQYGRTVSAYAASAYTSDYASAAMKSILFSSIPRNPAEDLSTSKEVDFLMAEVKEDYADDMEFDFTREQLEKNILFAMKPVEKSYDYLFFISPEEEGLTSVPFVFVYATDFDQKKKIQYSCSPESRGRINDFALAVSANANSFSKIKLIKIKEDDSLETVEAVVGLIMWTPSPDYKSFLASQEYLNCA